MKKKEVNVDLQGFNVDDFVSISRTVNVEEQSGFNNPFPEYTPPIVSSDVSTPTIITEQPKRTSSKQRKESLDEYRELFLHAPMIIDRQPIFISRELRDKIDEVVRKLGERKMSVSGFAENVLYHHLESYKEEVEKWKRL